MFGHGFYSKQCHGTKIFICDRRGLDHTDRVTKDQGRQPQFVDSVGLGVATTDPSLTQNLSQNF